MKLEKLAKWRKEDYRLKKLRQLFESYPNPTTPPPPSISLLKKELEGKEGLEAIVNYLIDLLIRSGYMLDKQINALEIKHQTEGGYNENLLRKRLDYRKKTK